MRLATVKGPLHFSDDAWRNTKTWPTGLIIYFSPSGNFDLSTFLIRILDTISNISAQAVLKSKDVLYGLIS